jgi:hypothetical protein
MHIKHFQSDWFATDCDLRNNLFGYLSLIWSDMDRNVRFKDGGIKSPR